MAFDYSLDFAKINFRRHPELYRIGKGEQGVLLVEPYKSELLPHWRFKTPEVARQSAQKLYELYLDYREQGDFVGMDMARKFIQMGHTRARRYANHRSGRKYDAQTGVLLPNDPDPVKAESAAIFKETLQKVKDDPIYQGRRDEHRARYES